MCNHEPSNDNMIANGGSSITGQFRRRRRIEYNRPEIAGSNQKSTLGWNRTIIEWTGKGGNQEAECKIV